MRKSIAILVVGLVFALMPALAGEGEECTYETQMCLDWMAKNMKGRGWAGVDLDQETMTVKEVIADSPADNAGLRAGDVLISINDISLSNENEEAMHKLQEQMLPGKNVTFTYTRKSKERSSELTLGEMPDKIFAQVVGEHMLDHAAVEVASNE